MLREILQVLFTIKLHIHNLFKTCILLILGASLALLSACGSDPGFVQQPAPAGLLRIVNAIPDSPGFAIDYKNQRIGFINFNNSTGFTQVLPDVSRDLKVLFAENGVLVELISTEIEIEVDHLFTVVITGTMASPNLLLIDEIAPGFEAGGTVSEVRIVHASPTSPTTVDFHLTESNAAPGSPLVTVAVNETAEPVLVAASNTLKLRTFNPTDGQLIWDSGEFSLPVATRDLYVLTDYFGPGDAASRMITVSAFNASTFTNEVLTGSVSYVNMISDRSAIDIYLDDVLVAEDLIFGDMGDYTLTDPGSYDIKITTANIITDIIAEDTLVVDNGQFESVIAVGIEDATGFLNSHDDFRRIATRANVAFTNASPTAGEVDVYVLLPGETIDNNRPLIGRHAYPASEEQRIIEGTFNLVYTDSGTKDIVLGPERIDFGANGLYRVYLTDALGGGEPLTLILGNDFDAGFNP